MTNINDVFENLTEDPRFLKLQEIGQKVEENRSSFNLVSIFSDLLDENAWSRILAYLMDSSHPHQLQKSFIDLLLRGHVEPWVQGFMRELIIDPNIRTSVITEWRTQNNRRVDILVKFVDLKNDVKAVIAFENKLYTAEHNMQLRDYQNSLQLYFPDASKFIFFLTPERLESQTSHSLEQCPCHVLSYEDVMNVCDQLSPNTAGQVKALLIALKQYLQNTFHYNSMDTEMKSLVYQLYQNPQYRTAMEMIYSHLPNIFDVFKGLDDKFSDENIIKLNLPLNEPHNFKTLNYYHTEYKIHAGELYRYLKNEEVEIHPVYMLLSEGKEIPKIGSKYRLRLMIHHTGISHRNGFAGQIREETLEKLGMPNSKGEAKHYWQWVNVWVGDEYELQDLGPKDVEGLINIIRNGMNETIVSLKEKLKVYDPLT